MLFVQPHQAFGMPFHVTIRGASAPRCCVERLEQVQSAGRGGMNVCVC